MNGLSSEKHYLLDVETTKILLFLILIFSVIHYERKIILSVCRLFSPDLANSELTCSQLFTLKMLLWTRTLMVWQPCQKFGRNSDKLSIYKGFSKSCVSENVNTISSLDFGECWNSIESFSLEEDYSREHFFCSFRWYPDSSEAEENAFTFDLSFHQIDVFQYLLAWRLPSRSQLSIVFRAIETWKPSQICQLA